MPSGAPASIDVSDSYYTAQFPAAPFVQRRLKKEEKKSRSFIIGAAKRLGRKTPSKARAADGVQDATTGSASASAQQQGGVKQKSKTFIQF